MFFSVKLKFYFYVCDFYNRTGKTIGVALLIINPVAVEINCTNITTTTDSFGMIPSFVDIKRIKSAFFLTIKLLLEA